MTKARGKMLTTTSARPRRKLKNLLAPQQSTSGIACGPPVGVNPAPPLFNK